MQTRARSWLHGFLTGERASSSTPVSAPVALRIDGPTVAALRRRVLWSKAATIALIAALHAALTWQAPGVVPQTLTKAFDVDYEMNFPSWFSSIQHFSVALALATIGWVVSRDSETRGKARIWFCGAAVACYLSADEIGAFHERLGGLLEHLLRRLEPGTALRGLLEFPSYYWLLVYAPVAIPGVIAVAVFAWRELGRSRRLALLGVFVFLYGAVGLDFIEGRYGNDGHDPLLLLIGSHPLRLDIFLMEEVAEMTGVLMILLALLRHLEARLTGEP